MKLKEILESAGKDILTEDTLNRIQESFDVAVEKKVEEQVQLQVESALINMDEDHSKKLKEIITAIDEDHTKKLKQVVEAIDRDHTKKLKAISEKYNKEINESAQSHLEELTEKLDKYLSAYLDEVIPTQLVEKAAKNTYASRILKEAKGLLAVDEKLANTHIREAVKDGAKTISVLSEENETLKRTLSQAKAKSFLESKTAAMPIAKATFIKKRLAGKPLNFIKENFEFVARMFSEKGSSSDLNVNLPRVPSVDRQESMPGGEIVMESNTNVDSDKNITGAMALYLAGMSERS